MKLKPILAVASMIAMLGSCAQQADPFPHWNHSDSLEALKTLVEGAKKEGSSTYIPVEDRIAVFDMDGTVFGELFPTYLEYTMFVYRALEDPEYAPTCPQDVKDVALEIQAGSATHTYAKDMAKRHGVAAAKAYAGMTLAEFSTWTQNFLQRSVPGFSGLTYKNANYKPMVDVVDYLNANDFTVYLVSGSDRYICREVIRDALNIEPNHIIGMDVNVRASGQGESESHDYQWTKEDELVRGDELIIKNVKFSKVAQIAQEIGKQPVISFGNTSGDQSMHIYTITDNKYPSAAFMLVADDGERDNGGDKNLPLFEKWQSMGFHTISMKNEFKTIYGDGVSKLPANA